MSAQERKLMRKAVRRSDAYGQPVELVLKRLSKREKRRRQEAQAGLGGGWPA